MNLNKIFIGSSLPSFGKLDVGRTEQDLAGLQDCRTAGLGRTWQDLAGLQDSFAA